jgi:hypothetical protein
LYSTNTFIFAGSSLTSASVHIILGTAKVGTGGLCHGSIGHMYMHMCSANQLLISSHLILKADKY